MNIIHIFNFYHLSFILVAKVALPFFGSLLSIDPVEIIMQVSYQFL